MATIGLDSLPQNYFIQRSLVADPLEKLGLIDTGFNDDFTTTFMNILICIAAYFFFTSSLFSGSTLQQEEEALAQAIVVSERNQQKVEVAVAKPVVTAKVEAKPETTFTLTDRVKFEGVTNGCVIPLCSKLAFLKMLLKTPTLLPAFIRKTLDNRPGEQVLIFVANGLPMAQQLGSFTARKNLNRSLRQVREAAKGIMKLAREAVSNLDQEDQDRVSFTTWEDLLNNEEQYEAWYNFIMDNEKLRAIVAKTAMGIVNYRISSFKKKGQKCVQIIDEEGKLLPTEKAQMRFGWTEESCAREITTLIWGFNAQKKCEKFNYRGLVYMTPNSTGMDLISGGAFEILKLMQAENMRTDLPEQSKLTYTELKFADVETKAETKPVAKDEVKVAAKAETKVAAKTETKVEAKVEAKPEATFTLNDRVKFEGVTSGCVIPLCSKPAFLKMLLATPSLLPAFIRKTLDNRPGEKVLIFVANGLPMAQQLGSFTARKNLNKSLRQVAEAAKGIMKLAREAVSNLDQKDQDRVSFTTWGELLDDEAQYEAWYNFIMDNEKTRAIVSKTAMGIVNYRISSFKKKGQKCVEIVDEEGKLLPTEKAQMRFDWTAESCAREITTLIWGFNAQDKCEKKFNYRGLVYMTPNSTGMDLISGGAFEILKLMRAENMRTDLPEQSKLTYTQLKMS